jgi:uncharacterized membrane protein
VNEVRPGWTEERLDAMVSFVLRLGVNLAAAIVLLGALVFLHRHGHELPHYAVFQGEPSDLRTIDGVVREAAAFTGRGLMQLGLLVLMATPVARVALSVVVFAFQRDRTYVVVTLIVLTLLLLSLTGLAP